MLIEVCLPCLLDVDDSVMYELDAEQGTRFLRPGRACDAIRCDGRWAKAMHEIWHTTSDSSTMSLPSCLFSSSLITAILIPYPYCYTL